MEAFFQKAVDHDREDPLSAFRNRFFQSDEHMIYLDGNSLGKLPLETIERTGRLIREQWGDRLIRSWNERWMDLPITIAGKIARVIGASEDEVLVGDTTSINLYKLAFAALKCNRSRKKVVSDSLNFPTDLYILQGLIKNHYPTHDLTIIPSPDDISMDLGSLEKELDKNTALITLSHVAYKSSFMYDMGKVNAMAHRNGSLVIWDLSHAAGSVPLELNKTNADMAVGCTYKYLNGGPGAPAFLYVRKDLQQSLINPIWAWFSHRKPFAFDPVFHPAPGIRQFATSTPSILSLAAIEPGLDLILEAGTENLRKKSISQSRFLLEMIRQILLPLGFVIASPSDEDQRGSHISIRHPEGYRINRAMIEPGDGALSIIPDFRPPDNIRLGIAPLYNSFTDLYKCIERLHEIVKREEYKAYSKKKLTVT